MGSYLIPTSFQGFSNLESTTNLNLMSVKFVMPAGTGGTTLVSYNSGIVLEGGMIIQSITARANASVPVPATTAVGTIYNLTASTDAVPIVAGTVLGSVAQNTETFTVSTVNVPYVPGTNNNYTLTLVPSAPADTFNGNYAGGSIVFDIQYYNAH